MAEEPVYFADASLKAAVEEALGVTNPTPTDMLRLTDLSADRLDITIPGNVVSEAEQVYGKR